MSNSVEIIKKKRKRMFMFKLKAEKKLKFLLKRKKNENNKAKNYLGFIIYLFFKFLFVRKICFSKIL
jgi:hypothetical protein